MQNKKINQAFFNVLNSVVKTDKDGNDFTRIDIATMRAEKIYARLETTEESSTTVFKLMGELMKYTP